MLNYVIRTLRLPDLENPTFFKVGDLVHCPRLVPNPWNRNTVKPNFIERPATFEIGRNDGIAAAFATVPPELVP